MLSLFDVGNIEPASPVAQAVTALTLSCGKQANAKACEDIVHRELLKALDSTDTVVAAAEFLKRLVFDLSLTISDDSGESCNKFFLGGETRT
jgi:hypothetical protein